VEVVGDEIVGCQWLVSKVDKLITTASAASGIPQNQPSSKFCGSVATAATQDGSWSRQGMCVTTVVTRSSEVKGRTERVVFVVFLHPTKPPPEPYAIGSIYSLALSFLSSFWLTAKISLIFSRGCPLIKLATLAHPKCNKLLISM